MKKFNEHKQLLCAFGRSILACFSFFFLTVLPGGAQTDTIVIIFKPTTTAAQINELKDSLNATQIGYSTPSTARLWKIQCTPGLPCVYEGVSMTDVNEVIKKVASDTKTEGCGKNYTTQLPPVMANLTNQDPPIPSEANLANCITQPFAPQEGETHPIIIALIDSGVKGTHTYFAGKKCFHAKSKSFIGGSHDTDGNGHGTHLAGIIRQMDLIGGGGNFKIMNLKTQKTDGSGKVWDAIQAVDYANTWGAHIINMSLGYTIDTTLDTIPSPQPLEVAINKANQLKNILVVASAGNDGQDLDAFAHFPSAFKSESLVSVAADSCGLKLSWFSNFGDTTVDLSAPGNLILGPGIASNTAWERKSGTSMAAAILSGAAGLLATHLPLAEISDGRIKCALLTGADPMGWQLLTGGKINADSSLVALTSAICLAAPPLDGGEPMEERSDEGAGSALGSQVEGLRAFPNPFSKNIEVRFAAVQAGEASWQVSNAFGQVVGGGSLACADGENAFHWNSEAVPPGLYVLAVETGGKRLVVKLSKSE